MQASLTQERLKELLHYDPSIGLFTRIKGVKGFAAGSRVGSANYLGYTMIGVDRKEYRAHRLAFLYITGEMPDCFIDHINGVKNDNRFDNLRLSNHSKNNQNQRRPHNDSLTGIMGVTFDKKRGLYKAQITVNCKTIGIGRYKTPEEAHAAYLKAKREMHASCTI
jgi:hypothetical protein